MINHSYLLKLLWGIQITDVKNTLLVFMSVLLFVLCIQWLIKFCSELRTLPPGPWGMPIIGYYMFMGSEKHTKFMELAKSYGSVYSARLGHQLTVVLSDYKIIRECFRREEFTGRPNSFFMSILNGFGIINSIGDLWKDQRRFLHDKLRQFGMTYIGSGNHLMEKRIMTEVNELIATMNASKSEPVDLNPIFSLAVSNVICSMMMSVRFTHDDERFKRFNFLIEEGMRLFGQIHAIDYIPSAKYLPGVKRASNKLSQNRADMFQFYREVIEEHRKTFDPNNTRDLIDMYLIEIENAKAEGREKELFSGKDHEEQIMQVIGDLFSAGMETIKTTLLWISVFMLREPDAMRRVQEELDQIVGRERYPSIEDLKYLPITESTILEVMRRSSIVPLATTHSPTRDVNLNGYTIPAGAHVIPLINSVHMDPTLWDKPEEFNPQRFINAEGKVQKPDFFIPFGVGRRMCLGDVLARMELFLFFASIMHSFTMESPDGEAVPSLKGIAGVTIAPQKFKVRLIPRPMDPNLIQRNYGSL